MDETTSKLDEDDFSIAMSTSMMSTISASSGSKVSAKKAKNKKKKRGCDSSIPSEINTINSPNTIRRNSAKSELSIMAQAALLDEEKMNDPDFTVAEQEKAAAHLVARRENIDVVPPLLKQQSALDMTRGEFVLVRQTKPVVFFREKVTVGRESAELGKSQRFAK